MSRFSISRFRKVAWIPMRQFSFRGPWILRSYDSPSRVLAKWRFHCLEVLPVTYFLLPASIVQSYIVLQAISAFENGIYHQNIWCVFLHSKNWHWREYFLFKWNIYSIEIGLNFLLHYLSTKVIRLSYVYFLVYSWMSTNSICYSSWHVKPDSVCSFKFICG